MSYTISYTDVAFALDAALSNGFTSFLDSTPTTIARDLSQYNARFEGVPENLLTPHIRQWQHSRPRCVSCLKLLPTTHAGTLCTDCQQLKTIPSDTLES